MTTSGLSGCDAGAGITAAMASPLWGKLSPQVTDEGATAGHFPLIRRVPRHLPPKGGRLFRRGGVNPPYRTMYKKRVRKADTPNLHSKLSTLNSAPALHFRQYRKIFFSNAPRIVHIVYCFTALKCAIL